MDRTTRSRLAAAGTVSVAGLLFIGACGGGSGGGTAASTSVVDSTAFRTIPVTAPPTTPAPVPAETSPASGGGSDTGGTSSATQQGGVQGNVYIVVANDYWYGIAEKIGVKAETLAGYNDMTIDTALFVGMQLRIPPAEASASQASGGSTSGPSSGSGGANSTQPASNEGYYIAVANDFWPAIAAKLGVDVDDLLQANGATMQTNVYVGQRIKIPS